MMACRRTYNVGGLDAETDDLLPVDIGCDILVVCTIGKRCSIV
jgi:hypothetical protein